MTDYSEQYTTLSRRLDEINTEKSWISTAQVCLCEAEKQAGDSNRDGWHQAVLEGFEKLMGEYAAWEGLAYTINISNALEDGRI